MHISKTWGKWTVYVESARWRLSDFTFLHVSTQYSEPDRPWWQGAWYLDVVALNTTITIRRAS